MIAIVNIGFLTYKSPTGQSVIEHKKLDITLQVIVPSYRPARCHIRGNYRVTATAKHYSVSLFSANDLLVVTIRVTSFF